MNDAALIRIHRFQCHVLAVLQHLTCHFARQTLERFLALCAVSLGVNRNADVLFFSAVDGQGSEVLNGIQCIASAADHCAHILAAGCPE